MDPLMVERYYDQYFYYLYNICTRGKNPFIPYRKLFIHLYKTAFIVKLDKDINRVYDALEMRRNYLKSISADSDIFNYMNTEYPCSVLEVIVALAMRCEDTIMSNTEYGDRTTQWIWQMIVSLGLGGQNDVNYDAKDIDNKLYIFMNRKYERNGRGGLFTIKKTLKDLRKVEIWCQMLWYLDTIE